MDMRMRGVWLTGFVVVMAVSAAHEATAQTVQASTSAQAPWEQANDASPAVVPDGTSVVFARGRGAARRIVISRREGGGWSEPQAAPFSGGKWMDMEPAMAPDGAFLVFASNRPAQPDGAALDGAYEGKAQPARGGNLWRVDRIDGGWTAPVRLPAAINDGTSVYAPAVAKDGSVYFMKPDAATGHFRLYASRYSQERYQMAQPLPFSDGRISDYDPAIAPDQSFIVFSSDRPPSTDTDSMIFLAFVTAHGWSTPQPLGIAGTEARLSPDGATLYFSAADRHIHRFDLDGWLKRHAARE